MPDQTQRNPVSDLSELIESELRAAGAEPGASIHGWRCEYPDRYGPCNCVADVAAEIAKSIGRKYVLLPDDIDTDAVN